MRMAVVSAAVLVSLAAVAEPKRGGVAFHYAVPLNARELDWYSRFEVLVTHDPLPRGQVAELHRRGTKLVLYEWAVAYYASLATPAHRSLRTLNRTPLRGHLGAADADAFYYDPATREHQQKRAEMIVRRLKAVGYDGVFLDTTTAESVHPDAMAEYRRRHPDVDYDEAFAGFLKSLDAAQLLVISNQGYRRPDHVLPYVDWDVTESLITYPRKGAYVLRPWQSAGDEWNSIAHLFRKLITPAQRKYPRVRFTHINYVSSPDPERIEEIVAIARLYGHDAYIGRPDLAKSIETDLYFLDLGKPKARVETASGAYRYFEKGFVALNTAAKPMRAGKYRVPARSALIERSP